jgi:integrase/recombinase XerC
MILQKSNIESRTVYTFFDEEERVVVHPSLYLRNLRNRNRPITSQRQVAHVVKLHCQWIENSASFEDMSVDQALAVIDDEDILDWINKQRTEGGVSESTINNRELLVRGMYRWLTTSDSGHIRHDIPWTEGTFTKQSNEKAPRFVTPEQTIKLLSGMHNESQRVASHFIYDTGVRISELVRLRRSCLPDEDSWPKDVNYYPLMVSGSKPREKAVYDS